MELIAIINYEISLGETVNALAHMSLGMGHRIEGEPDINVFFGDSSQVKAFKTLAAIINTEQKDRVLVSDFINTMTGGNTHEQLAVTAKTTANALTYLGCCFMAEEVDMRMMTLIQSCLQLNDYIPWSGNDKTRLLAEKNIGDHEISDNKISMLINNKLTVGKTINAIILSSLRVGKKAKYPDLYLLDFIDMDGGSHRNISFYPFVILKPENASKHNIMAGNAENMETLVSETIRDSSGQPLVTVVFGARSKIDEVILRKQTRLFNGLLEKDDLIDNLKIKRE